VKPSDDLLNQGKNQMTFPLSRKESVLNYLLKENRGFIYKIDKVHQIRRIRSRNAGPLRRG